MDVSPGVSVGAALAAEPVSWYDIPAVRLVGGIAGALLLLAAIRSMFGKRR